MGWKLLISLLVFTSFSEMTNGKPEFQTQDAGEPQNLQKTGYEESSAAKDEAWARKHGIGPKELEDWQTLDDHLDYIDDDMEFSHREELMNMAMLALHGADGTGDVSYSEGSDGTQETADKSATPWTDGIVPYIVDPSLKKVEGKILNAMEHYRKRTCTRFVRRTYQENYVVIGPGKGCNSYIGMIGGRQHMNLDRGCRYLGTMLHELGHVLGLIHEHQRPDRDDYIIIHYENIKKEADSQFAKYSPDEVKIQTEFNYKSIMIYGNYAFSKKPGELKSLEAKDGTPLKEAYQKYALEQSDVDGVNAIYNCQ